MMSVFENSRKHFLPWIMGLFMAILFLVVTHAFCYLMARRNLDHYAAEILTLADRIALQLQQSIDESIALGIHDCSEQNLVKMRMILWNKHFVNDIAVVKDQRIICSAVWGEKFNKTQAFSKVGFIDQNGYKKIENKGGYLPFHSSGNITTKQDIAVVTAPYAFENISTLANKYDIRLTTPNDQYVFFQTKPHPYSLLSFLPLQSIDTTTCLKNTFFCVHMQDNQAGIAHFSWVVLWMIAIIGAFFGVITTYILSYTLMGRNALSNRLKRAIRNKTIYVEYQPIVEMKTQRISGVEALVRWKDKKYGQVSPELFIRLAENANIDGEITKLVLSRTLADCVNYIKFDPKFSVSINLGKSDLTTDGFIEYAHQKIQSYFINPHQVVFEITERVNIDIKDLENKIQQIKNIGCRVSLDDFGTGTSNLSSLSGLSFNLIKIDRMFIRHFTSNQYWENILDAILSLAQENNHPIIFEGVETVEQYNYLSSKASNGFIQGWLFYKSMDKHKLHDVITKNHGYHY
ncbi:EAL domain-containing protein [Acinetobacter sp. MB5]|uniref:EAL domain-containing protein n=1 Tax=Acinetobacter sp. MB5 TaxID=2069438 RepID=UPI000DD0966B|nr:EAL domain-containing protein [Acinetobacter sp. MB5]